MCPIAVVYDHVILFGMKLSSGLSTIFITVGGFYSTGNDIMNGVRTPPIWREELSFSVFLYNDVIVLVVSSWWMSLLCLATL